jgi:predicted fused transcriptional regulator/phosphomethylpyrimidine kinase/predicted transcriptional regulator
MKPPCELVQKDYLYQVRARLARELNSRGCSQTFIAETMHITQPAVSKYLNDKTISKDDVYIDNLVMDIANMIQSGTANDAKLIKKICESCMLSRIGGEICEKHRKLVPSLRDLECEICTELLSGQEKEFAGRANLLSSMLKSIHLLEESSAFAKLIPQVRANLVTCDHKAKSIGDVLAIPGRITIVEGRARALVNPRFGSSRHTASLLLWVKSNWDNLRSCICIAGSEEIISEAKAVKFNIIKLTKPTTKVEEIVENLMDLKISKPKGYVGIHVPGGFGIEPILYLFGYDVEELVDRILQIAKRLL